MSVHALCRPSPVSRSSLAWGTSRQWRRERAAFCTAASCSYGHETHAAHESSGEATTASRRAAALGLPLSVVAGAAVSAVLAPPLPAFAETAAKPAVKKQGAGDWSSPGLAVPEDESAPKFFKTPSGIRVQELARGGGKPATPGSTVLFDYIIRRSNGYFIYSTVEGVSFQPRDVPVGPVAFKLGSGALIAGLDEVLADMQVRAGQTAEGETRGLGY